MQIGTFTKVDNGDFIGRLDTLTLSREIAFEPVSNKESDKSPDYRIRLIGSDTEIGAGWNQTSKSTGNPYIKAKIDAYYANDFAFLGYLKDLDKVHFFETATQLSETPLTDVPMNGLLKIDSLLRAKLPALLDRH